MTKYVATPVGSGFNSQANLNQNFEDIEDNFQRVLYRDGSTPNQMEADLDMNDHDIYNVNNINTSSLAINGQQVVATEVFVTPLPDPAGQTGKYIRSDGVAASWQHPSSELVLFVDTVADMKAMTGLVDGAVIFTKGYSSVGVGPAKYQYDAGSAATADEIFVLDADTLAGQFELLHDDVVSLSQANIGVGGDDTAKMEALLTGAATLGVKVVGSSEEVILNTPCDIPDNTDADFGNATFDITGNVGATKYAFRAHGSLGASSALTVNGAEGAYSVTVANGALFSVGEDVLIWKATFYPYVAGYNVNVAQNLRIRSIVGNVLTFTTALTETFNTADTSVVNKVNWVENIKLKGGTIIGSDTAAEGERGITFKYVRDFSISEVKTSGIDIYGIEITSSIRGKVDRNYCSGVYYDGVTGTNFYGIALLNSCAHISVVENKGRRNRHLVITTAASTGQGVYGEPMHCVISHNLHEDSEAGGAGSSYAFESHGFGRFIDWIGNRADNCYAFMRIEGGRDLNVIGGGCSAFDYAGILIGGNAGTRVQRVKIDNVTIGSFTNASGGYGGAVFFSLAATIDGVTINGKCYGGNNGTSASLLTTGGTGGTQLNVKFDGFEFYPTVENTVTYFAVITTDWTGDLTFSNCLLTKCRNGVQVVNGAGKVTWSGGEMRNDATAGVGFGFYTNGANSTCINARFTNINTPIRGDTSSTNFLTGGHSFAGNTGRVSIAGSATITPSSGDNSGISADNGDAAKTLTVGVDVKTQLWNTPLTAARAVTLSTTNIHPGARWRIVRGASATGAFNLNVGTGPLKALAAASQWCEVEYSQAAAAWVLVAYGTL